MNEIWSGTFNTSQRLSPCIPTHGSTNENESDPSSQTFSRIHLFFKRSSMAAPDRYSPPLGDNIVGKLRRDPRLLSQSHMKRSQNVHYRRALNQQLSWPSQLNTHAARRLIYAIKKTQWEILTSQRHLDQAKHPQTPLHRPNHQLPINLSLIPHFNRLLRRGISGPIPIST